VQNSLLIVIQRIIKQPAPVSLTKVNPSISKECVLGKKTNFNHSLHEFSVLTKSLPFSSEALEKKCRMSHGSELRMAGHVTAS
jgi:hypothetical protein